MPQAGGVREPLTERYVRAFPRSQRLHARARGVFPDGVTHDSERWSWRRTPRRTSSAR